MLSQITEKAGFASMLKDMKQLPFNWLNTLFVPQLCWVHVQKCNNVRAKIDLMKFVNQSIVGTVYIVAFP